MMLAALTRLPREFSLWLSRRRRAAWAIAALGVLLGSPALWTQPVADDLIQELLLRQDPGIAGLRPQALDLFRFASGDPVQARALMNEGVFPWWTDPQVRLAFFRPLSALTHWIDWRWFSGKPWVMHLHSLAWYAALIGALALTYRRLMAPAAALLALCLFAVDDAHAPVVAWISNRNAIIAVCFLLLALGAHDVWRKSGRAGFRWLSATAFAAALLAGETGVAGAAYFVAYACFLERGSLRARATSLLGPLCVLIAWRVLYVYLGYGTSGSGVYFDPASSPLAFTRAAAERVPVLLLATIALPWADFWEVYGLVSRNAAVVVWCLALAVLFAGALLFRPLLRQSASARFWAAGALLSALPAAATFPHDRMLLAVTVGWTALLAEFLTSAELFANNARRRVAAGLVVIHAVAAPLMLPLRAANVDQLSGWLSRSISEWPAPAQLARSTLVLLNPPLDPLAAYLPLYLQAQQRVRPRRFVWLASGISAVQVRRLDSRTLAIRPEHGYLQHSTQLMLRSPERPLPLGSAVRLDAATFQVTALTPDGRPAEVSVRFEQPLDDPSLLLMRWHEDRYVRFAPPLPNEVTLLPAADFARLFSS